MRRTNDLEMSRRVHFAALQRYWYSYSAWLSVEGQTNGLLFPCEFAAAKAAPLHDNVEVLEVAGCGVRPIGRGISSAPARKVEVQGQLITILVRYSPRLATIIATRTCNKPTNLDIIFSNSQSLTSFFLIRSCVISS